MSQFDTMILYVSVISLSSLFAFASQIVFIDNKNLSSRIQKIFFILSFLTAWLFFAFAGMSNDYEEYKYIYNIVDWTNFYRIWIEPGYALVNLFIKTFDFSDIQAIIIIKTLIISLVYISIYKYKKIIPLGLAVMGYLCTYYLDAYCMLRIHLAASILFYALCDYVIERKPLKLCILVIVVATIHYSALFVILPIVISYIFCRKNNKISLYKYFVLIFILIIILQFYNSIFNILVSYIPVFYKYGQKYNLITKNGTGLYHFIYHLPWLLVFYQSRYRIIKCVGHYGDVMVLGLLLAPFSFFFASLGYKIEVVSRVFVYFMYLWIVVLPVFCSIRINQKTKDSVIVYIATIIWFLISLFVYLQSGALTSAGIDSFIFI